MIFWTRCAIWQRLNLLKGILRVSDTKLIMTGNQVSYRYPIKEIVTIDYDRNDINGLIRKYQKKCDDVSNRIDREEILLDVEYTPVWDIDTPFEDAALQ